MVDGLMDVHWDYHTKTKLLDPRGYFVSDHNFPSFLYDYMAKVRLCSYNARKVVAIDRLEEKLSVGMIKAADRASDEHQYASYSTEVPRVILALNNIGNPLAWI